MVLRDARATVLLAMTISGAVQTGIGATAVNADHQQRRSVPGVSEYEV
jgi:hypothetical protein